MFVDDPLSQATKRTICAFQELEAQETELLFSELGGTLQLLLDLCVKEDSDDSRLETPAARP
jgi:hypothetical protein